MAEDTQDESYGTEDKLRGNENAIRTRRRHLQL